jgi:hypothetical protein
MEEYGLVYFLKNSFLQLLFFFVFGPGGNDIDLRPMQSRFMQKHSFYSFWFFFFPAWK